MSAALVRKVLGLLGGVVLVLSFVGCPNAGSGATTACQRLNEQCARCVNALAQDQCFRATELGIESTCQELLDSGTYESSGVECASPN